jgi:hypothetical protein
MCRVCLLRAWSVELGCAGSYFYAELGYLEDVEI